MVHLKNFAIPEMQRAILKFHVVETVKTKCVRLRKHIQSSIQNKILCTKQLTCMLACER